MGNLTYLCSGCQTPGQSSITLYRSTIYRNTEYYLCEYLAILVINLPGPKWGVLAIICRQKLSEKSSIKARAHRNLHYLQWQQCRQYCIERYITDKVISYHFAKRLLNRIQGLLNNNPPLSYNLWDVWALASHRWFPINLFGTAYRRIFPSKSFHQLQMLLHMFSGMPPAEGTQQTLTLGLRRGNSGRPTCKILNRSR